MVPSRPCQQLGPVCRGARKKQLNPIKFYFHRKILMLKGSGLQTNSQTTSAFRMTRLAFIMLDHFGSTKSLSCLYIRDTVISLWFAICQQVTRLDLS